MDWLRWAGTGAFLTIAGYSVVRLVVAGRVPAAYPGRCRAVDMAQVLMGVGMAAMAAPVGGPQPLAGWQTVFLLLTAWFVGAWWSGRGTTGWHGGWHGNDLHHALVAVAMLYMLLAMPPGGHHDGHNGAGLALPALGWAFAAYFACSAVLLARVSWREPTEATPAGLPAILVTPRVTASCQVTMALGSGSLLVIML